jgi:DNA-3-methyladenine glycosylase
VDRAPFSRALLDGDTLEAARLLLGARLVRGSGFRERVGRIVEVEAYIGQDDLASHARFGPTKRNAVMFGSAGLAYLYLVYGMHYCLNVVTEQPGRPGALLVRAVEPLAGVDEMRRARLEWLSARASRAAGRGTGAERARLELAGERIAALPDTSLASGPGLVCAAFSIGWGDDGIDLCDPSSDLRLDMADQDEARSIQTGPRVGIGYAPEPWLSRPWRYWIKGNAAVSGTVTSRRRAG